MFQIHVRDISKKQAPTFGTLFNGPISHILSDLTIQRRPPQNIITAALAQQARTVRE